MPTRSCWCWGGAAPWAPSPEARRWRARRASRWPPRTLRHLNPFPLGLAEALERYRHVLVPEMNLGQLAFLLQGRFLKRVVSYTKVQGKPFFRSEIHAKIREILEADDVN